MRKRLAGFEGDWTRCLELACTEPSSLRTLSVWDSGREHLQIVIFLVCSICEDLHCIIIKLASIIIAILCIPSRSPSLIPSAHLCPSQRFLDGSGRGIKRQMISQGHALSDRPTMDSQHLRLRMRCKSQ